MNSKISQTEFIGTSVILNKKQNSVTIENCRFSCHNNTLLRVEYQNKVFLNRLLIENSNTSLSPGIRVRYNKHAEIQSISVRNLSSHRTVNYAGNPIHLMEGKVKLQLSNITQIDVVHISIFEVRNASFADVKFINAVDNSAERVGCQFYENKADIIFHSSNIIRCSSTDATSLGLMRAVKQDIYVLYIQNCAFYQCDTSYVFFGETKIFVENCHSDDFSSKLSVEFDEKLAFKSTFNIVVNPFYDILQITHNKICRSWMLYCLLVIGLNANNENSKLMNLANEAIE